MAPRTGAFTFDTSGSRLDTLLAVYRWDDYQDDVAVEAASNDNFGGLRSSRVSFLAEGGGRYYIAVDSKSLSDTGEFPLHWAATPPPAFAANPFLPASALPGAKVTLKGTNFIDAMEVRVNGIKASFIQSSDAKLLDRQLVFTVPLDASSGPVTVRTSHGSGSTSMALQVVPPALSWIDAGGGGVEIHWAAASKTLILESCVELLRPVWAPVPESVTFGEQDSHVTILSTGPSRFFRLRGNN